MPCGWRQGVALMVWSYPAYGLNLLILVRLKLRRMRMFAVASVPTAEDNARSFPDAVCSDWPTSTPRLAPATAFALESITNS